MPDNLQERCDGCGGKFSADHALNGKCGSLVMVHRNDFTPTFKKIVQSALGCLAVTYESFIEYCRALSERHQAAVLTSMAEVEEDTVGGSERDRTRDDGAIPYTYTRIREYVHTNMYVHM